MTTDQNTLLLSNAIASVEFLRSLGDRSFKAENVGIDDNGRLFIASLEKDWACQKDEYTDQVKQYEDTQGVGLIRVGT